jgi:hypothetical protein
MSAAGVVVDYDPAVWLPGPTGTNTDAWVEGAFSACAADFGLAADAPQASYLRELLTLFASHDLHCDFRFLRLRTPTEPPLIARLSVYAGVPAREVTEALTTFDPDASYYDRAPQVTAIDPDRGLRRATTYAVDGGVVRPLIRYHRHVEEWDAGLVLASSGATLQTTAAGLGDLDALARSIWLVDANGSRR